MSSRDSVVEVYFHPQNLVFSSGVTCTSHWLRQKRHTDKYTGQFHDQWESRGKPGSLIFVFTAVTQHNFNQSVGNISDDNVTIKVLFNVCSEVPRISSDRYEKAASILINMLHSQVKVYKKNLNNYK